MDEKRGTITCISLTCPKYRDHRCCVGCKEEGCEDRCKNHPDRCKLVQMPKAHGAGAPASNVIVSRSGRKYRKMDPYEAERLWNAGYGFNEIAEKLGVTRPAVVAWAKAEGVW